MRKSGVIFFVILAILGGLAIPKIGLTQVAYVSFPFTGSTFPLRHPLYRSFFPGEGLRLGPFQVHPTLGFASLYTDNVFRDTNNRQSDIGYFVAPGLQAFLPLGERHELLVDYRAVQQNYQRFPENNVFTHEASGLLKMSYSGGLKLNFHGLHVRGFDPRGSLLDLQRRDLTTWNTNTFTGRAEYMGIHTGMSLSLRSQKWNFENNNQAAARDFLSNSADVTFFAKATPNTYATLNIGVADIIYDENKQLDGFMYSIHAGLTIPAGEKFSGELLAGLDILNFKRAPLSEDAELPEGLSPGGNTQKRISMRGKLNWQPTPRLSFFVQPFRRIRQAAVFSASTYIATGFVFSSKYDFGPRTSFFARTFYSNNEFTPDLGSQGREDDLFQQTIGMNYMAIRWLAFKVGYFYSQRSSNLPLQDFYANSIMISVQGIL